MTQRRGWLIADRNEEEPRRRAGGSLKLQEVTVLGSNDPPAPICERRDPHVGRLEVREQCVDMLCMDPAALENKTEVWREVRIQQNPHQTDLAL